MSKIASSKDLIILLLYAKGYKGRKCEPIKGRTRLMKIVFLFEKEIRKKFNLDKKIPKEALPDFEPYDYGPFSSQVYVDLEFLVDLGFVKVKNLGESEGVSVETDEYEYWQATSGIVDEVRPFKGVDEFSLAPRGRRFVEQGGLGKLTDSQTDVLDEFKARCTEVPLKILLKYVYTKYPKTATSSKIVDEIITY